MSKFFLGVDGGQSSTTALIGDESGRVVGFGRGGPCNHVGAAEGRPKFLNAVGGCVRAACEQAGLERAEFEVAYFGLSGGNAGKEELIKEFLSAKQLTLTHDALIGLSGACAGEPGIMVNAGTGSIAFGRNAAGQVARAGGWGFIFGDEGAAFDITRQGLRAALRQEEGWGPPTVLRERLLEATGARNADELMHWFYTIDYPRSRVATFSKLVDTVAAEGDLVAQQVIDNAARELASLAAAIRQQIFLPGEPARVCYVGGVFRSARLLERFRMLVELEDGNRCGTPIYGPATGALIEAYRLGGLNLKLTNIPEFEK